MSAAGLHRISRAMSIITLLVCLGCVSPLYAQERALTFDRFSVRDGLSHNVTQDIVQDHRGFLWIGTRGGLNRYDGQSFQHVDLDSPDGDQENVERSISVLIADEKRLWIGTWGDGLLDFQLSDEKMTAYRHDPGLPGSIGEDRIQSLLVDRKGRLWVGTFSQGLSMLSRDGVFSHWRAGEGAEELPHQRVWCLAEDGDGRIWAGTGKGLAQVDPAGRTVRVIRSGQGKSQGLPGEKVHDMVGDGEGGLWLALTGVVSHFDPSDGSFRHYPIEILPDEPVFHIFREDTDTLWLGTNAGAVVFSVAEQAFTLLQNNPFDTSTLSNNVVNTFYMDQSRVLWLGTFGGVNKVDRKPTKFVHIRNQPQNLDSLSNDRVGALLQDRNENLWIGTFGGGLNRFAKGHFSVLPTAPEGIRNEVRALLQDSDGTLWVGTWPGGLLCLNPNDEALEPPSYRDAGLSADRVLCLAEGSEKQLWIGTEGGGLNIFQPDLGVVRHRDNDAQIAQVTPSYVNALLRDRDDSMWLGSREGLHHLTLDLKRLGPVIHSKGNRRLSHDQVHCLFQDREGHVWVGTKLGLNRLEAYTGVVRQWFQRDGLPHNDIRAIQQDRRGNLWISTNSGLTRFDPVGNRFHNFGIFDGLQDLSFVERSALTRKDGTMFFGGDHGYNRFHPERVLANPYPPPVVLTRFEKMAAPVDFGRPTDQIGEIDVREHEKIITFEFAALDFTTPKRNTYAFKLEGFSPDWTFTQDTRANYTNLDAGTYVFRVKAANNDGVWNEEGIAVQLRVIPPFYKTPLAYFCYGLLAIALGYAIPTYRIRSLKRRKLELEHEVTRRTREISLKNRELGEKNKELEDLDEIVRIINNEVALDQLTEAILRQAQKMFPSAESGIFLIGDTRVQKYQVTAHAGYEDASVEGFQMEASDLKRILSEAGITRVDDIFCLEPSEFELALTRKSKHPTGAILLMMVPLGDEMVGGVLLLDCVVKRNEITPATLSRLKRYRQHVISAIGKAALVNELTETARNLERTQQLLIESAHRAGMAEIASNVAHTLGNTLNSISTSTEVIMELGSSPAVGLFARITDLLEQNLNDISDFIVHDRVGRKVPKALVQTSKSLLAIHEELETEVHNLSNHISYLKRMMSAQQEYAQGGSLALDVDLIDSLEDVVMFKKDQLEENHIELLKHYTKLPSIRVSRPILIRVLMSLINNSIEAMEGCKNSQLILRTSFDGADRVYLEIEDNGRGVEVAELPFIFSQGYSRKHDGSGFGLHYCANVVKEMGGGIHLHSDGPGKGAIVNLYFEAGNPLGAHRNPSLSGIA